MSSTLPRFNGPAQARQRMRLIAALGMLAIAALATGGLASLTAGRPAIRDDRRAPSQATSTVRRSTTPLDMTAIVEEQLEEKVEQVERELREARALLRTARQLGQFDPQLLDNLERRLDRSTGRPPQSVAGPSEPSRELMTLSPQPRAL